MNLREQLIYKKRIVIKVGTSSLTYPNGKLNFQRIEMLAKVLAEIQADGREVILVSSGAMAVGSGRLGLKERPSDLAGKQALAALGQAELIRIYQKFFDDYHQIVAQVLLTKDGLIRKEQRINAQNTINMLLSMKIIPIINENDTVSTEEIEFGDNDTLSAYVAVLINADLLVLLSDIDGMYSADPKKDANASIIPEINSITGDIEKMATGAGSSFGTGGMATKVSAARECLKNCIDTIIANGSNPEVIKDILDGKILGTLFTANKLESK